VRTDAEHVQFVVSVMPVVLVYRAIVPLWWANLQALVCNGGCIKLVTGGLAWLQTRCTVTRGLVGCAMAIASECVRLECKPSHECSSALEAAVKNQVGPSCTLWNLSRGMQLPACGPDDIFFLLSLCARKNLLGFTPLPF
jgi:hypothetical protein